MPSKLVTVAEMIAVEQAADAGGLTYDLMMANAGRGLAAVILDVYAQVEDRSVLALVGKGNNGGDALVALALLAEGGWQATAYFLEERGEADQLVERVRSSGGQLVFASQDKNFRKLKQLIGKHALLMDGLLGTGIKLPLRSPVPELLKAAKNALAKLSRPPQIVAVDCPSGVDCDTGAAAEECLQADLTVCMAAVKAGMLKLPAYTFLGDLRVVGIGLPKNLKPWKAVKCFVPDQSWARASLPPRPLDAHKGTFGTALIVAGSVNYTGAVLLAGEAAYRSGAGLVTLAVPAPLHSALAGHFPEATWLVLPHETGVIAAGASSVIYENLDRITAVLFGPGFGLEAATQEFVADLLAGHAHKVPAMGLVASRERKPHAEDIHLPPLVVDADGLKHLSRIEAWYERLPVDTILTPHPGEMSILTGLPRDEVQEDRIGIAERFAAEWGQIVVLKGAFTVIASPDGRTAVVPVASPALARAGTGDVLAGMITGLRAQGVEAFEAAAAAAYLHAQAGLAAAHTLGSAASVLAGDLIRELPALLN